MKTIAVIIAVIAHAADVRHPRHIVKKPQIEECAWPKRLIERDALASDAGRKSEVICK